VVLLSKQGVALTGRNRTGPPQERPRARLALLPAAFPHHVPMHLAVPPAGSVTDDNKQQTPASKKILAH